MSSKILGACLVLVLASGAWAQGRLDTDINGVLDGMNGNGRNLSNVTNHILRLERTLVDLLLEVAEKYGIRYEIPKDADPRATLATYREGRDAKEAARAGFAELGAKIETLRAAVANKSRVEDVKRTAQEAVVLLWALKGHCFLETIDFANGGKVEETTAPGGEPDFIVIGALGQLRRHHWRVTLGLLGDAVDTWADNAGGIAERRRQAAAVGLTYPNATNPLFW